MRNNHLQSSFLWERCEVFSSSQGVFGSCWGIVLLDIQGDCNRKQQPLRNAHLKNIVLCERDLGSLPVGREDLEAAGGVFC